MDPLKCQDVGSFAQFDSGVGVGVNVDVSFLSMAIHKTVSGLPTTTSPLKEKSSTRVISRAMMEMG